MTQKERLKKLIMDGKGCPDGKEYCITCKYLADGDCDITRLADYLLENGVIVSPVKEPVIPVSVVREYLLNLLDEWDKLGNRKYDLPNMQVHNHIRAELDALEKYLKENHNV